MKSNWHHLLHFSRPWRVSWEENNSRVAVSLNLTKFLSSSLTFPAAPPRNIFLAIGGQVAGLGSHIIPVPRCFANCISSPWDYLAVSLATKRTASQRVTRIGRQRATKLTPDRRLAQSSASSPTEPLVLLILPPLWSRSGCSVPESYPWE